MKPSIAGFCAVITVASALMDQAQSQALRSSAVSVSPMCAAAARSLRGWGWNDGNGSRAPISSIVAAINRRLRMNDGRLPAADIARLRGNASSEDVCTRDLSVEILRIQNATAARAPKPRLAVAEDQNSVTRWLEKQSPTREAISP